jgi:hypothetical protein
LQEAQVETPCLLNTPAFDCVVASNDLSFDLQLRKIMENLYNVKRKALGCSGLKVIRFIHLAIVGDGLEMPVDSCRTWLSRRATGSTLGQRKYLASCPTRVLLTSANFEPILEIRDKMWLEDTDPLVSACYLLIAGTSNKAKTLGL